MKIRNKYINIVLSVLFAGLILSACEDMLDTNSDQIAFEDEHKLSSPNDSVYSVFGILSQLQRLGDRYVVLGELRGDLMTVSEDATVDLKEINNFQISADNSYLEKYDYYNIINNCNYALHYMDTSIVSQNQQVMLPEYAAIKVFRAWTYWQMVQVFGAAAYYEEPILNLEAAQAEYPVIGIDAMAEKLIADLHPFMNVRHLNYGTIDGLHSPHFFIPIKLFLGDLYLYLNKYEDAARMYHAMMYEGDSGNGLFLTGSHINVWSTATMELGSYMNTYSYRNEIITRIPYSSRAKDFHPNLLKMAFDMEPMLLPAQSFVNEMAYKVYFHANSLGLPPTNYLEGDLRGTMQSARYNYGGAYRPNINTNRGSETLIYKFLTASMFLYSAENTEDEEDDDSINGSSASDWLIYPRVMQYINTCRQPHLYLRYAEAVNRAGKPTLAFSVLKYGLSNQTITNPERVNPSEIENNEPYIDFTVNAAEYNNRNYPSAARGRGYGVMGDNLLFIIPELETAMDSILYVEDMILEEMAAETAFEGNRFFDLLRVSRRRNNHPEYMATKVASKYDDFEGMKARLMNQDTWFLK